MLKKKKVRAVFIACVLSANLFQPVFAQTTVAAGTIKQISTGWSSDAFGITTSAAIVNPAGCLTPDMYQVSMPAAGYSTHYAAALAAFSTGSQISVTVSNTACTQTRPTIIGLQITAP